MFDAMQFTNQVNAIRFQAGGDKKLFEELYQKELALDREKYRKRMAEEEIKGRKLPTDNLTREQLAAAYAEVGCKPLTDGEWQDRQRMKTIDPATLTKEEWQKWRRNHASLTVEDLQGIKECEKERKAYLNKERQRRQDLGWSGDLGDLGDGHYVDVVLECAEKQGVDPRSLTPGQRQELRIYNRFLSDEERKLNPRARYAKVYNIPVEQLPLNLADPLDAVGFGDMQQSKQGVFDALRETWEANRLRPDKDFLAFQQWFWSLPLDVVIDLWERAPRNLRPELEPPVILQIIEMLFDLLRLSKQNEFARG